METPTTSPIQRRFQRARTGRASFRTAALLAGAVGLAAVSPALAAPRAEPATSITTPSPGQPPTGTGFVASDRSTLPQAGKTEIQVPDPASDSEVKGQYGVGVFLLVLGGLIGAAFFIALFRVVMRRTWDSNHAPASRHH
jgi:hypothetical protein